VEVPSTQGRPYFKYEENLPKHIRDMSKQTFKNFFIFSFFRMLGRAYLLAHFSKFAIKKEILLNSLEIWYR